MTDQVSNLQPDGTLLVEMSRRKLAFRNSDEHRFRDVYPGRTRGQVHLSDGQETAVFDICVHRGDGDQLASSHCGQGHGPAKGGNRISAVGLDIRVV